MEKKHWSKEAKVISVFLLFAYGIMALIAWWGRSSDFEQFKNDLIQLTGMLLTAYVCIGAVALKRKKTLSPSDESCRYPKSIKILSYVLVTPFILIGILTFVIMAFEKEYVAGFVTLILYLVLSIPFFFLPRGIHHGIRFIKRKSRKHEQVESIPQQNIRNYG